MQGQMTHLTVSSRVSFTHGGMNTTTVGSLLSIPVDTTAGALETPIPPTMLAHNARKKEARQIGNRQLLVSVANDKETAA